MEKKHLNLIKYLSKNDDWMTSLNISRDLKISIRSVKNYINDINKLNPNLIISSHDGYRLNKKLMSDLDLMETKTIIPQTQRERINYIIKKLIFSNKAINIFDLSEEIFISENTIRANLVQIREKLSEYKIELITKNNELKIDGEEKNKRKIMSAILYDELDNEFVSIGKLRSFYDNLDVDFIIDTLKQEFSNYNYLINDYAFMNLILHIIIAIDRIQNNYSYKSDIEESSIVVDQDYLDLAKRITNKLTQRFNIDFGNAEIKEIALIMASSTSNVDLNNLNIENFKDIVGDECWNIVNKLMDRINKYYYIYFGDSNSIAFFILHIKNLLSRCKNNVKLRNPLTENMKNNYPVIYDSAISIAQQFKEITGYDLDSDEICYLALHVGSTIEAQQSKNEKISALILSPEYYGYNSGLVKKLQNIFNNDIYIKSVFSDEEDIDNNYDLIITTLRLSNSYINNSIEISPFVTEKDKQMIDNKIKEIKIDKKRKKFYEKLKTISNKDMFMITDDYSNETELIVDACDKMFEMGYVSKNFVDEVLEREKLASTAFGSIAIPHSLKMEGYKTGMFVIKSNKGIKWHDKKVNLVLLMSSNVDERKTFLDVYDVMSTTLQDERQLKIILECDDYESFVNSLTESIN